MKNDMVQSISTSLLVLWKKFFIFFSFSFFFFCLRLLSHSTSFRLWRCYWNVRSECITISSLPIMHFFEPRTWKKLVLYDTPPGRKLHGLGTKAEYRNGQCTTFIVPSFFLYFSFFAFLFFTKSLRYAGLEIIGHK